MESFIPLLIIAVILIIIARLVFGSSRKKSRKVPQTASDSEVVSNFYYLAKMRDKLNLSTKSMWQMRESLFKASEKVAKKTLDEIAHQTRLEGLKSMQIKKKSLLNNSEVQMFYQILGFLREINAKHKRTFALYPQVSLRAFVSEEDAKEFWYIAGNRYVDFVVVDSRENYLYPKCVIEYFGGGHFGDNQEARDRALKSDEIKQEILKKINLPLIIIQENDSQWKARLEEEIMQYR